MFETAGVSLTWIRIMYGVAVIGAGAVGLTTLFAPRLAGRYIFAGSADVDVYLRILAALWIALGFSALLGLAQPEKFIVVLFIQIIYKSVWLLVVAIPAIARGHREPGLVFISGLFLLWVIGLIFAVPFPYLLTT